MTKYQDFLHETKIQTAIENKSNKQNYSKWKCLNMSSSFQSSLISVNLIWEYVKYKFLQTDSLEKKSCHKLKILYKISKA